MRRYLYVLYLGIKTFFKKKRKMSDTYSKEEELDDHCHSLRYCLLYQNTVGLH